ncbi:MAG: glucose-6-phosphate isomerase [Bacteroidales bacterium]|nr:glucose-6-phosphate isomerase [Bacteroidales bacterium]
MVKVNLGGCSSFVNDADYKAYVEKALSALEVLENETGAGNDFLGWKHLPSETLNSTLVADCEAIRDLWKSKGVDLVVVIGIGGSYLGAKCALEALSHQFGKQLKNKGEAPEIVFAGQNLSEEYMCELMDLVQERNAACVVISKSGTTTEPAVAFRLIKKYLEEKYGKTEAAERIVAVTDKARGALKGLATQEGYNTFVIEDNVGGRFSVLTPVGILPIVLAGFDMKAMLEGALEMEKACAQKCECNPAIQYAAMRNALYNQGKKIEILVAYNPKLTDLGEWWKQLYGESEGKNGLGIFPASVNFTTDLHSMGQYIQDGERTLMETVVTVEKSNRSMLIENDPQNLDGLNFLTGKHVEECNAMAELGTKLAHIDGGVPQISLSIERINEYNLGAIFYFFEKACGISGYMLGVNPFDQPGVEAYKKNMFALLGKPGYEAQAEALKARL